MSKVLIPLAPGFEELEAVTLIDVLRRAKIEVVTVGVEKKLVTGAHNILLQCDEHISSVKADDFDMIVLPGGWGGTKALAASEDVKTLLSTMKAQEKYIAAICAAPFALNSAGVLNHNYTCYPSVEEEIRLDGYQADKNIVVDGKVLTSRGPGTALEFALYLIETLQSAQSAKNVKEGMLV